MDGEGSIFHLPNAEGTSESFTLTSLVVFDPLSIVETVVSSVGFFFWIFLLLLDNSNYIYILIIMLKPFENGCVNAHSFLRNLLS